MKVGDSVKVSIKGIPEITAKLKQMAEKTPNEVLREIGAEGEFLLGESKKECPHDTGYLRNSGYSDLKGDHVEVGYSAEYALPVHERVEAHHKHPTKAKYLEDPFNRRAPLMHENIAKRLRWKGLF